MRRITRSIAIVSFLMIFGSWAKTADQPTALLFHIARTKNTNQVYYEVLLNPDGTFVKKDPIHAYWIMWAKDSTGKTREGLTGLEKRMAYGYSVSEVTPTSFKLTLVAFKKREIDVRFCGAKPCAIMQIDGKPSILQRLFVVSSESGLLPHVSDVTLFGKDLKTGKETIETIRH